MAKVSLRAYNREIEAMIDRNHLDEAIAHCRHILKSFPKHLDTYRLLGKAYLEYKRYPEAADIFARVLVAMPNDFVSNVGMSIIRDEENKLDDAVWHMERAFETQPSNAAIQSELQRLYSRRDGVQLPRIRMTRGALAHMYVQGELYPQAISEIKSVLKEDPGRTDMQALLARAYYRSGAKNDAAEVASTLLRTEPYCLEANRILVEILGTDHPENVQAYRQRVVELDPYAAQVSSSIFLSDEVPDVAVSLERLDWNGQPVGLQPDWETQQAISLEGGRSAEDQQPDWLKSTFGEAETGAVSPFDAAPPSVQPVQPGDEIPDFLRAAGWGQSTGSFDESQSGLAGSEPTPAEGAIAPGDLPDWVKAMAPEQPSERAAKEEELPDWINKIDKSALPAAESSGDPDWMSQFDQPASQPASQPAEEQPDWLSLGTTEQPAASSAEQPDWLKGFETESASSAPSTGELDWLSQLGQEAKPAETPASEFEFTMQAPTESETSAFAPSGDDLIDQPARESETLTSKLAQDDLELLKEFGLAGEAEPAAETSDDFDFLNELKQEGESLAPASSSEPSKLDNLGRSPQEQEDSFAWLESLAAKQGATEGLLTQPEERLDEEPDWIKQSKDIDLSEPRADQPPVTQPANLDELGKSGREQDDSFAWLESLAAKQGATEGLLTRPEERLEEEPEWVRQAKSMQKQPQEMPAAQAPEEKTEEMPVGGPEPEASLEELGKSEAEREDAFAWLESLAAKQGATEGLLTQPEERLGEEPEWVKQAKDVSAEQLSRAEPPSSLDDTAAWLRSLDEEEVLPSPEPVSAKDDTAMWFKKLEQPAQEVPPEPAATTQPDELPAWMQNIEEETSAIEGNIPVVERAADTSEKEPVVDSEWMSAIEQESAMESVVPADTGGQASRSEADAIPSWLSELDQEQEQVVTPSAMDADLPAWLRDETGELLAEPTKIEPTRATDWHPVEAKESEPEPEIQSSKLEPEPVMPQVEAPPPQVETEPVMSQAEAPLPELEPVRAMAQPEVQAPRPEPVEVVSIIEERIAAVQKSEIPAVPALSKAPKPKGTGRLSLPPDPILGQARNELSGNNLSGALESYTRLIKKGRFLDEVIFDLRDALYRFPVDVNIWQSLGDAYMRANRLQDALDAYTKAEELLR
jgi:tetratricopeptide (TPR) repeat protein